MLALAPSPSLPPAVAETLVVDDERWARAKTRQGPYRTYLTQLAAKLREQYADAVAVDDALVYQACLAVTMLVARLSPIFQAGTIPYLSLIGAPEPCAAQD